MMKNLSLFAVIFVSIACVAHAAEEVEYAPGGKTWAGTWSAFYNNPGDESELMAPLIKAGPTMVPAIIEAIAHADMRMRRYAIGALGHLGSPLALAPLGAILENPSEEDYMRGDAILAIYQINPESGEGLAKTFLGTGAESPELTSVLNMNCQAILNKEPWLNAR